MTSTAPRWGLVADTTFAGPGLGSEKPCAIETEPPAGSPKATRTQHTIAIDASRSAGMARGGFSALMSCHSGNRSLLIV